MSDITQRFKCTSVEHARETVRTKREGMSMLDDNDFTGPSLSPNSLNCIHKVV